MMLSMLILWSKYPDLYISTARATTIRDAFGFTKSDEHYTYFGTTSFMYSDENKWGTNPSSRAVLSLNQLKTIAI